MKLSHQLVCFGAVLAIAACSGERKGDLLANDSSLTRDLELASVDTSVQPQLRDVPDPPRAAPEPPPTPVVRRPAPPPTAPTPTPAPRPAPRPNPTPAPPPPAPVVTASGNTVEPARPARTNTEGRIGVIAAGTSLNLASGQQVCTNTNSVGDRFTASLVNAVTASNGVVIPAGATAVVEVSSLKRSERAGDNIEIGLIVRSISYGGKSYPISGEITSAQVDKVRASDNNDAAKVIGGAAVGAILGRVFGGKNKTKGTVIGAAGGAAAGAVIANQTGNYNACIKSGGRIAVRLNQPISVQDVSNPMNPLPAGEDGNI